MTKKKEMTIDDLAVMVMNEFNVVREELHNEIGSVRGDIKLLQSDMTWVKDILEAHTKMLKDLGEEKVFIVHRTDRIENDVEIIKKRLKVV